MDAEGRLVDPLAVYGALLPKAKVASVPRAQLKLVETVLCDKGRIWKWFYTAPSGEVAEKVHTNVEAIHESFLQSALAVSGNVNKLMMLIRRTNGRVDLFNIEQSVEFFRRFDEELQSVVALQKYVHSRGGDRSIYRVTYQLPSSASEASGAIKSGAGKTAPSANSGTNGVSHSSAQLDMVRFFEYLRPMDPNDGGVSAAQADIAPMKSTSPSVNASLEQVARKVIPYAEHNLRGRITFAELDCVLDEREQAYLLWPTEVRQPDNGRRRSVTGKDGAVAANGTRASASSASLSGGMTSLDGAHRQQSSGPLDLAAAIDGHPALAHSGGGAVAFDTLDPSHREAEAALQAEFESVLDQTFGNGQRGCILLVDTDASTALLTARALAETGYAVTVMKDAPKALAHTRRTVYDCLLIGKRLPSLTAVEFTRMIRQRETTLINATRGLSSASAPPYLPIVVLTGETDQSDLKAYMECGMDGCVAKPLDVPTLLSTMAAAIPYPPISASHQGLALGSGTSSESGSLLRHPSQQSPGAALPVLARGSSRNDSMQSPRTVHGLDGAEGQQQHQQHQRDGSVGAAAALFADNQVDAYMQGQSMGSQMQGEGQIGSSSSTFSARGSQEHALETSSMGQGTKRRSSAGSMQSPYQQNQVLSLRRSSTSIRRRSKTAQKAGGTLASIAAATGGKPGVLVLPAGAAIPGIGPPVAKNETAGQTVAAGGGGATGIPRIPVSDEPDGSVLGVFQLDSATSMPYCVMGTSRPGVPLYHLVIVSDMFETYETYQILLRKTVIKLPGLRVLLFNYPGQAYTEWRRDVVLNNEYLAGCLQALLTYVGLSGTRDFDLDGGDAPFYLVGAGNGANVASYFASAYYAAYPNMRAVVAINSFAFIDPHLAAVFHDCVNVFSCTPPTRPDLPVYFFARFLFSSAYLQKVGAPLALNLHTAVFNPITLEGRTALCRGALSHVDLREQIADLPLPFILVSSSADGFVKPTHTAAIVDARGGETRSIKRALLERNRAVVIWLRAGHEVFQEARKPMINLLEQLATGFHETNDITFLPLSDEAARSYVQTKGAKESNSSLVLGSLPPGSTTALAATQAARSRAASLDATASSITAASGKHGVGSTAEKPIEDRFLDSIMKTMRSGSLVKSTPFGAPASEYMGHGRPSAQVSDVPDSLRYEPEVPEEVRKADRLAKASASARTGGRGARRSPTRAHGSQGNAPDAKIIEADLLLDASLTSFERRDEVFSAARARKKAQQTSLAANSVLTNGGQQYSLPEVKEYMSWRIRRNRKRLARIEACATSIQRCWRSYLARTLVMRMRQQRACVDMQSWWRGIMARRYVIQLRRELWAATTIQRCWRGYYGRILTEQLREERRASVLIQKNWKGYRTRKFVNKVKTLRSFAATKIQALVRRWRAQKLVWRMRDQRNAATNIQRVYRGHLGRKRAVRERDKFLFSKSQAQGIEFARQMLMEHKLHATKLQSEVSILSKEKLAAEERVEALLNEIGSFETGTQTLERQMLDLSRAEAEAAGTLDEAARVEIREAKIRLDREFSLLLTKIADRREQLSELELKLQAIDRTRTAKREELKDLERKLVVLLEHQQGELQAIRTRQDRRQENMVEDAIASVTAALRGKDPGPPGSQYAALTDGSAGSSGRRSGGSGPLTLADGPLGVASGAPAASGARVESTSGPAATSAGASALALAGPTPQQRAEAAALMASTETMMKFGFMSMSLTYFSSLNMIKAMKQLGTANTALAGNPMLTMLGQMGAVAVAGGSPSAAAAAIGAASGSATKTPSASDVSLWTVADVGAWLDTVYLGQYKDAFADAAVDGAFLCELTEEDLRNTLGIEHALHRKKLLSCIIRLRAVEDAAKLAQVQASTGMDPMALATGRADLTTTARRGSSSALTGPALRAATALHGTRAAIAGTNPSGLIAHNNQERAEGDAAQRAAARDAGILRLDELMSWVRHNKGKLVAEAVQSVPDGRFDPAYVRDAYLPDVGTVYVDVLNGPAFHVNKADDKGNTLLTVAAQNGRMKIAQLLIRKGANPNHQNAQGNTPLHFAMAYRFHDLAAWLVDPEKGGADDALLNQFGLAAYDGLGDGR